MFDTNKEIRTPEMIGYLKAVSGIETNIYKISQTVRELEGQKAQEDSEAKRYLSSANSATADANDLLQESIRLDKAARDKESEANALTPSGMSVVDVKGGMSPKDWKPSARSDGAAIGAGIGALAMVVLTFYDCSTTQDIGYKILEAILVTPIMAGLGALGGALIGLAFGCVAYYRSRDAAMAKARQRVFVQQKNSLTCEASCMDKESKEKGAKSLERRKTASTELAKCNSHRSMSATLATSIEKLKNEAKQEAARLAVYYEDGPISSVYRNLPAICSIYQDIRSGACTTLKEAYTQYNQINAVHHLEKAVCERLDVVIDDLHDIKDVCHVLEREISSIQADVSTLSFQVAGLEKQGEQVLMQQELGNYIGAVNAYYTNLTSQYASDIAATSAMTAAATTATAANTSYANRIASQGNRYQRILAMDAQRRGVGMGYGNVAYDPDYTAYQDIASRQYFPR